MNRPNINIRGLLNDYQMLVCVKEYANELEKYCDELERENKELREDFVHLAIEKAMLKNELDNYINSYKSSIKKLSELEKIVVRLEKRFGIEND